jgi:RNA polymerase sigma-54 factor
MKMSPQMLLSIKMMELPVMDLREKIEEEIEKNPALEIIEDKGTVSLDRALGPKREEKYDYFESTSDSGFVRRGGEAAAEAQHRFIEGVLSRPETLQEHLLWQLALEPVEPELRGIAETLIRNLDGDGFNKEPLDTLFKVPPEPAALAAAVRLVQGLDPQGTCTSGYRESLEVQARLLPDPPDGIFEALACLDLCDRKNTAAAERKLRRGPEELADIMETIKTLSPFPGRLFSNKEVRYVVPDLEVTRKEGEFIIILNDEEIPVLGISPFFMDLAQRRGKAEKSARDFARENMQEARWFMQSINQRNHTLLRVARAIVEFQRAFFTKGPQYLSPLTLKDIAEELGIHEATVSRTANGKYMQTEWGIFELRHFFTNSISGAGSEGSRFSKTGVKQMISEIVEAEKGTLTDQDIADLLAKRGVSLARRTVAKYRKELDLASSYNR